MYAPQTSLSRQIQKLEMTERFRLMTRLIVTTRKMKVKVLGIFCCDDELQSGRGVTAL